MSKRKKRPEAYRWLTECKDRCIYRGAVYCEDLHKASLKIVKDLYKAGAVRVEVGRIRDDDTDELYVTIDPRHITKELLELIVELRPDEFWEEEPNVYRLWWD